MAKIQRVTGKIFGGTATATGTDPQIGQFGSALAGTYLGTTDISTIQSLPAWGQGFIGAVTTDNQFPALPEVTGFGKVLSQQQCYLLQQGVAEWDSATTYYTGNFCAKNSVLYVSLTDENLNNDPESDTVNWELYASGSGGSYIGQLIFSILPQTEAGLHLLDGTIIDGAGVYARFVDYIKNLYINNPTASYFTDEADWQTSVTQYGVCGKFVYNASANTVRLPKVTGILEGTIDANALGDLIEAGLPNITGYLQSNNWAGTTSDNSALYPSGNGQNSSPSNTGDNTINIDASRCNPIYGNSTTVQPQAIKGYYYIVVATSAKTDIEVDIDNIVTDLNQKVDISNMVEVPTIIEVSDPSLMPSWYRVWSNGWCEMGGTTNFPSTIAFLREFKEINYTTLFSLTSLSTEGYEAVVIYDKTTTSMKIKQLVKNYTGQADWYACGYIKQGD